MEDRLGEILTDLTPDECYKVGYVQSLLGSVKPEHVRLGEYIIDNMPEDTLKSRLVALKQIMEEV